MSIFQDILDCYPEGEFLSADGLEDAVIGVDEKGDRLVYSVTKIIDILMNRDGMTDEEALEYYYYNIEGAYMGEKTPIYCNDYL